MEVKNPEAPASAKQVGYIMSLAVKAGISPDMFEAMFGVENPAELNKGEASMAIEQLKARLPLSAFPATEDVSSQWASNPANSMAEDPTDTASAVSPPYVGPHYKKPSGKTSPLPATAPNQPFLYVISTPEIRWYSIRKSKSGNVYALKWLPTSREWDYVGQSPLRAGEVAAVNKSSNGGVTDFIANFKSCPACTRDLSGMKLSVSRHACKDLKVWGIK